MRVLLLSNNWDVAEPVREFLNCNETVTALDKDINSVPIPAVDIIVSYCYRYILKGPVLKIPAVNLHNSFLPWGRGAQPLFWAVVDDEPCGVSVHWIDEGLDTGPVIAQRKMLIHPEMTFRQAYEGQHRLLSQLFIEHWPYIRNKVGTRHTAREFEAVRDTLGPEGWDCTIATAKGRWRA